MIWNGSKGRIACFVYLLAVFSAKAQSNTVPEAQQADLLLKVMNYDRAMSKRSEDVIRIGIIYNEANTESMSTWEKVGDSLFDLIAAGKKVGNKKITFSGLQYTTESGLEQMASSLGVAVFYVMPGNTQNLQAISNVAKRIGVLTYSGVKEYIANGVASGVEMVEGKAKIVIHLPKAKEQGASFRAELLKLARVIQ